MSFPRSSGMLLHPTSLPGRFGIGDLLWRSAARLPDKTALVYRGSRWSYAELDPRVNRCAHALATRGVSKGDRIALLSHNNDLFVVLSSRSRG